MSISKPRNNPKLAFAIPITSGRPPSARSSDTPTPAVEILKFTEAPAGVRIGFCDVAFPAVGIILHDCAVFENLEDGATRLSIGLPTKKVGERYFRSASWIDKRSELARAMERAIIAGLVGTKGAAR